MKRMIAAILVLCMVLCSIPVAAAASFDEFFADVPATVENDASYPFAESDDETCLISGNKGVGRTTSALKLTFRSGGTFRFSYKVSSESNYDYMAVTKNGTNLTQSSKASYSGAMTSFQTYTMEVAANDVVTIGYSKDYGGDQNDDTLYLKDFSCKTYYGVTFTGAPAGTAFTLTDSADASYAVTDGKASVPAGEYRYTAEAFGYAQATGSFTVTDAAVEVPVTMTELARHKAAFSITGLAAGTTAAVTVKHGDNVMQAEEDGSYLLFPADYSYQVKAAGYKTARGTFTLGEADTTVKVTMVPGIEWDGTVADGFAGGTGTQADPYQISNGEELAYAKTAGAGNTINYLYTLVPGGDYSYVATQGTYYHAKKSFTLGSSEVIEVSVVQGDWLTSLALGNSENTGSKGNLFPEASFSKSTHTYTVNVPDYSSAVYAWVTVARGSCNAVYPRQSSASGGSATVSVVIPSKLTGTNLMQALLTGSAYSNVLTFRVSYLDKSVDVTYYTDYMICLERTLSLKNMSVSVQGGQVLMNRSGGTGFSRTETDYSVLVPAAASSLKITVQTHTDSPRYGDTDNGYLVSVNGKNVGIVENAGAVEVPLNGTETDEEIKIVVTNIYNQNAHTEYRLTIKKAATTAVAFQTNPKNALIYIYEQGAGNRVWPTDDGIFALSEGFTYYCSISLYGYAAQAGALQIVNESGQTVLRFGEEEYTDPSAVPITLQKADANPNIVDFNTEWANFRGTDSNNGVTSAKTPISAADGMLYWAVKLGDGYSSDAVSSPILVDNCLIVYAGEHIYRVNKATGVVEATGQMAGKSSFAINGPTYYDGILLVGLSNGRIQAFSAKTLESLWLYTDPLGGQPNCPITILNGYAYTGFWNGEDKDGSFVCVSLTDEDPENQAEEKAATWRMVQNGGFYWAGAYACDDFVMVGTDDGKTACSYIYLLDPLTGKVLDSRSGFDGDIRSTICYDKDTDAYYFTSKGGGFYRIKVQGKTITACDGMELKNGIKDETAMSTSTPVVYNGRAYIGVSGTGQFTAYSGHNITVIDLENLEIAYSVPTQGYPQTSGMLTTAYEQESGYVYVYFFDNYTPGKLRILRDKKGQNEANYLTSETFNDETYRTAYALFTPVKSQAQYAICSPIADNDGTIYFKNDSAFLMAFGRSIEKIEVTTMPQKTKYTTGETFDKTGMVVTATLSDGSTRDVTEMVSAPTEPLTDDITEISLVFGRNQTMYRNLPNGEAMTVGNEIPAISTTLQIRVGDTTDTGALADDLTWSFRPAVNTLSIDGKIPEGHKVLIACYDDSGKMTKLEVWTVSGSVTLPDSAKIRVFYIDGNSKPLCAAAAVLG